MTVDTKTCIVGFPKWPFLPVFADFGRFGRSCPFCTLPLVPLGTTNSQESLEIIIYIQTASHKNFSMWWCYLIHWKTSGFSKMAVFAREFWPIFEKFLCVFVRFCRFGRSCPFCTLPRVPLGTTNSQESLEIIIYIQTASHKNFSMWWRGFGWYQNLLSHALKNFCAFLCVFARLVRGFSKMAGKSGNYNIYSNG